MLAWRRAHDELTVANVDLKAKLEAAESKAGTVSFFSMLLGGGVVYFAMGIEKTKDLLLAPWKWITNAGNTAPILFEKKIKIQKKLI